jgi:hypothetical protein
MQRVTLCLSVVLFISSGAQAASKAAENVQGRQGEPASRPAGSGFENSGQVGRFQLFLAPGHSGSPFLLDTATGCIWHQVQHPETKRTTFVEVDVENLHWNWGSGAQQILASRVDSSNLSDEQKRLLKENLQKTGCGLSNVVLTPGPGPGPGATSPAHGQSPK